MIASVSKTFASDLKKVGKFKDWEVMVVSEVSGKVIKILIDDASPVEYDQDLFVIDPK